MARSVRGSTVVSSGAAALVVGVPLGYGLLQLPGTLNPSNLGVFSIFVNSPWQLVLPILAVALGCSRLYEDLGDRHVANLRPRMSVEGYLLRTVVRATLVPFLVFTCAIAIVGIVSFSVWPLIGDPFIDPSIYHPAHDSLGAPDLARFTYSELMRFGWPVYLVSYAAFFGLSFAVFSALGSATLLLVGRRSVALLIPWAVYLVETIVAALLGAAHAGLMYSIVPFGLQPVPALRGALPVIVLSVIVGLVWAWVWRRRYELPRLR